MTFELCGLKVNQSYYNNREYAEVIVHDMLTAEIMQHELEADGYEATTKSGTKNGMVYYIVAGSKAVQS